MNKIASQLFFNRGGFDINITAKVDRQLSNIYICVCNNPL